jgi:hypothetical protein
MRSQWSSRQSGRTLGVQILQNFSNFNISGEKFPSKQGNLERKLSIHRWNYSFNPESTNEIATPRSIAALLITISA